jgi:hypothetical protein
MVIVRVTLAGVLSGCLIMAACTSSSSATSACGGTVSGTGTWNGPGGGEPSCPKTVTVQFQPGQTESEGCTFTADSACTSFSAACFPDAGLASVGMLTTGMFQVSGQTVTGSFMLAYTGDAGEEGDCMYSFQGSWH